jgi:hypothetical protein
MNSDIMHRLMDSHMLLTSTTCRWPMGDPHEPGFRFCMEAHAPGRTYCPEHHVAAFGKSRPKPLA